MYLQCPDYKNMMDWWSLENYVEICVLQGDKNISVKESEMLIGSNILCTLLWSESMNNCYRNWLWVFYTII